MTPGFIFPYSQPSRYDSSLSRNVSGGLVQNIMIDSYYCYIFLADKTEGGALWPFNLIGLSRCTCICRAVLLTAGKEATFPVYLKIISLLWIPLARSFSVVLNECNKTEKCSTNHHLIPNRTFDKMHQMACVMLIKSLNFPLKSMDLM